jgi:hypothetical protein
MATIPEDVLIEIQCQNMTLVTKPSSDSIRIDNVVLTKEQAASLAWLINHPTNTILELGVKVK